MNESSTRTIGARIKLAREILNISKHDLARQINTSSHNIAGWENGIYEPSLSQIIPLATALKCNVRWLLGEEELDIPGKLIKDSMGVYSAHLGESAKNEMHSRRLKMLQVMPVLDKRISETLEENGIPGFYSLDAVRLLLAVYEATNSVMPGHYEDADSDF